MYHYRSFEVTFLYHIFQIVFNYHESQSETEKYKLFKKKQTFFFFLEDHGYLME